MFYYIFHARKIPKKSKNKSYVINQMFKFSFCDLKLCIENNFID